MIRDPMNDKRIIAYLRRAAPLRNADPWEFSRRYVHGLAIQRDLYQVKPAPAHPVVIPLPRKRCR